MFLKILKAYDYAREVLNGHYTPGGEPRICHNLRMAGWLADNARACDEDMVVVALVHDLIDAVDVRPEAIGNVLGMDILSYVSELANGRSSPSTLSPTAQAVMASDIMDTVGDCLDWGLDYAVDYVTQAEKTLENLCFLDPDLYDACKCRLFTARQIIDQLCK